MEPLINKNGITIKQLKELIKDLPEKDEYGEEYEFWVINSDSNTSNIAKTIMKLNKGDLIVDIN